MKMNSAWLPLQLIAALLLTICLIVLNNGAASAAGDCRDHYTVQRGDTLARIAQRFGRTVNEVQSINRIPNVNRIYVGQQLCLEPDSSPADADPTEVSAILTLVNLNVRSGPSLQHEIVGRLSYNSTAGVLGASRDGQWWRIVCPTRSNPACWVSAHGRYTQTITPVGPMPPPLTFLPTEVEHVSVVADHAVLYAGPGTDFSIVGGMFGGLPIRVNGVSADGRWWHAHCPDAPIPTACDYWVSADVSVTMPIEFP